MTTEAFPGQGNDHILDNSATYEALDPTGLGARLAELPHQCAAAWERVQAVSLPDEWKSSDSVVIGGMGGSAIAGDLVADLASLQETVPVTVVRDFHTPFKLGRSTLMIACSYSGNTEETRSLFHQAMEAHSRVMVVAGGGSLAEEARERGVPVLEIAVSGEPRSAVGYNLMLLLGTLDHLGLLKTSGKDVDSAIQALTRRGNHLGPQTPTEANDAKQLAEASRNRVVLVYGGGIFSAVARRWKTQINENAKAWAFYETLPELLHNSVEAYGRPSQEMSSLVALLLQPRSGPQELAQRYRALEELLRSNDIPHRILEGAGGPPIEQVLDMLQLGDYVSYYLAMLHGVNPSPTPAIDAGKLLLDQ